jgi:hypothetical protein
LKTICCICSTLFAGARISPLSSAAWNLLASARKPIFGLASKTFCQPAVSVQISSQHGRHDRHPGVLLPLHLEQHHRAQHQCHAGQHLVGNAEQRPQAVDAAERIDHALVQDVAPGGDAQTGGDQVGGPGVGLLEGGHEGAQQILQHEASGTRTGVAGGQDEQRFEEDGEVVPEGHHRLPADDLRKDLGHSHGQRRRTAGTREDGVLADVPGGLRALPG